MDGVELVSDRWKPRMLIKRPRSGLESIILGQRSKHETGTIEVEASSLGYTLPRIKADITVSYRSNNMLAQY